MTRDDLVRHTEDVLIDCLGEDLRRSIRDSLAAGADPDAIRRHIREQVAPLSQYGERSPLLLGVEAYLERLFGR